MAHLWDALCRAYQAVGFDESAADDVFRALVLARIIEPTSKLDSLRVLVEVGVDAASYATLKRRLPIYAERSWRRQLAAACAKHTDLGPASLVLFDVSTLYFETDTWDGFRELGFSKERRLDPQITIGLLTDASGFPLTVQAFGGNKAETLTMIPTITAFMAAHDLSDVTIVADAGSPTWSTDGARPTPMTTSQMGRSSPSRGRPVPATSAAMRSSTTSTSTTGPAEPCAASTSRSPRPRTPSLARPRSPGRAQGAAATACAV